MEKLTTAQRLKQIMSDRGLKQVDILEACKPYCEKYKVRLGKNDLSQYISGKVQPGQDKLSILGLALNVNEVWLMGYDVAPERDGLKKIDDSVSLATNNQTNLNELFKKYKYDDLELEILKAYFELDYELRKEILAHFKGKLIQKVAADPSFLVPDTPEELEKLYPPVDMEEIKSKAK